MSRYSSYYPSRNRSNYDRARQHIREAEALHNKYGAAYEQIKNLFLNLNNERVDHLLDAYGRLYGISAQEYADKTYYKWRHGYVKMAGQTMTRLFDLLPQFMTPEEKLQLIRHLREQTLKRLHKVDIKLTLSQHRGLTDVAEQVIGLVQRIGQIELPADFREIQGWITESDAQAMKLLLQDTETYIATQRLADLLVHLGTLSQLRQLASLGLNLKVVTQFQIPTASVEIRFTKNYWKEENNVESQESDSDLIVRLQEIALRQEQQDGNLGYVDYVLRTLTPAEQAKLRAMAAQEGLKTEVLLKELQVKTIAARGDIQSVMDTAAKLKENGQSSKISSEHQTASGVTRIEIDNKKSGCLSVFAVFGVLLGVLTYFAETWH